MGNGPNEHKDTMMKKDWWSCDGGGGLHADGECTHGRPYTNAAAALRVTRRSLLVGAAMGAFAWKARTASALAGLSVKPGGKPPKGDVLVTIFLRGGADGLNIVVPHGEDAYYRRRPTLAIAPPGDRRTGERALELDLFFGLNPALAPLLPLYRDGRLAFVHACGSDDRTRSHFEAMNAMERGLPNARSGAAGGWLARHLAATQIVGTSPLRAVAFSSVMPDSLRGGTDAIALESLAEFRLIVPEGSGCDEDEFRALVAEVYEGGEDAVAQAGRDTLDVLETMNRLDPANYTASNGAVYPEGELGNGLRQVAFLIKNDIGLEVACLDKGGWDTHVAQGSTGGWMTYLLDDLGKSLAAFAADMGAQMDRVTVIAMTEFGRRVRENGGFGTDHGRAGAMILLGGGTVGGKVHGEWPGLEDDQLEPPGDLRVTTDYRDVLAEVLSKRLHRENLSDVFPGHTPAFPGCVSD
ncbi:MAG: DUF1501 domain-containing protein [Armatimonadetes bacterium]|nr:DUF1501 domain-containing protein [Armatimonadota bacterium]